MGVIERLHGRFPGARPLGHDGRVQPGVDDGCNQAIGELEELLALQRIGMRMGGGVADATKL
jgi:hypothetical protein